MGVNTTILSQKTFSKLRNGADFSLLPLEFTENLASSVMRENRVVTEIEISWIAESSQADTWTFRQPTTTSFIIERSTGSFLSDGFWNGAACRLRNSSDSDITSGSDLTITYISQDGKRIEGTTATTILSDGDYTNIELRPLAADASNSLTALIYGFGLIQNNEQYSSESKVSGNKQEWYASELSASETQGKARGIYNDWVTGEMSVEKPSASNIYSQRFIVYHSFIVNPYYLDGEIENIQNGTVPDLLNNNTLKYAFDLDLRIGLSNPNKGVKFTYDNTLGSVGYYDVNFNGFDNDYNVESIEYEDADTGSPLEGIAIIGKTKATITVSKLSGAIASGQRAGVLVSYLPTEDEYINTETSFRDNFLYDSLYHNEGDAAEVGTNIIKSLNSSIVFDELVIVVEFEYTSLQREKLSREGNYIIAIDIEDASISAPNSDAVVLRADINTYQQGALINGLVEVLESSYLVESETFGIDSGFLSISEAWDEDNIIFQGVFELDLLNEAFINSLEFSLVAYNSVTDSYFLLDTYSIQIVSTIVNGIQQIDIESTRNYTNLAKEQFNIVQIKTGDLVGGKQRYSFAIGQKIKWQDWILNSNVDADVFFDNTKPNNNLNFKSSNYSGESDYQIKMIAVANSTGLDELGRSGVGLDVYYGGDITVKDFGESDTVYTIAEIDTFDPDTNESLEGQYLQDGDTLVKSEFSIGSPVTVDNKLIIHRIQQTNALGDDIKEFIASLSIDGNSLIGSSLLDASVFEGFDSIDLTARLFSPFEFFSFFTTWNTAADGTFDPVIDSGVNTWILGDDSITDSSPLYTGSFLDGEERGVKVIANDQALVTELTADSLKIIGEMDLSLFTNIEEISLRDNQIDDIKLDVTTPKTLTFFDIISNDFPSGYELDMNDYQVTHNGEILISQNEITKFKAGPGSFTRMQCYQGTGIGLNELDLSECAVNGDLQINVDISVQHDITTLILKSSGNSGNTLNAVNTSLSDLDFSTAPFSTYNVGRNSIATTLTLASEPHSLVELEAAVFTSLLTFDVGGAILDSGSLSVRFRSSGLSSSVVDLIYNQLDLAYDGISDLSLLIIDTSFNDSPTAASAAARSNLSIANATIIT